MSKEEIVHDHFDFLCTVICVPLNPEPLNVSREPYVHDRISVCRIQRELFKYSKTYNLGLRILQLPSFILKSLQNLNFIIFKYFILRVEYRGHHWHILTCKG